MSCLTVLIRSLRKAIEVAVSVTYGLCVRFESLNGITVLFERLKGADVKYDRIEANMGVSVGLICSVGVGKYEFLECSDLGFIRTYDKGFIIVPKR